jgi:5-hydroxyisourate hydrolase-like protein (transthyretin family)
MSSAVSAPIVVTISFHVLKTKPGLPGSGLTIILVMIAAIMTATARSKTYSTMI